MSRQPINAALTAALVIISALAVQSSSRLNSLIAYAGAGPDAKPDAGGPWVTAWATSQQGLGETAVTNATVRLLARATVAGAAVRIRLDNTFGTEAVRIGHASIGLRVQGPALAVGSVRILTFNQATEITLPPGGSVWSDPAPLAVRAQQDLAVSLHIPGTKVRPSQHTGAVVTSYATAEGSGDAVAVEGRDPFVATMTTMPWLKAIDIQSSAAPAAPDAIVAFGDSITDGTCSTLDAHDRWEDVWSLRLGMERSAPRRRVTAVVNEGIGGNTVIREGLMPPPDSPPGLERLDRDVLSHHGVTGVVVFMGTNDVRRGASAAQVIGGLTSIAQRIKAKGVKVIGVTIVPRHNVPPTGTNTGWDPEKTRIRNEINQWIRTRAPFDAVIDFDKVVRDPGNPDLLTPAFNCGDGIHPSPAGYYAMGKSVDLRLFDRAASRHR